MVKNPTPNMTFYTLLDVSAVSAFFRSTSSVAKHTGHSPKALQAALPANLFNLENTPTAIHAMSST